MQRLSRDVGEFSVLHIAAPGPMGGAESVLVGLTAGLRSKGVHVSVAAIADADPDRHPVIHALRDCGVPVHPIAVPRRAYLRERRDIRRLLETSRPDIVHTHGYRVDLLDSGIARGLGIPTVATIHGSSRMNRRTDALEAIQFRLFRRFQAVVAVSRPLVTDLRRAGVAPDRIRLVPNAWDGRTRPLPRGEARKALGLRPEQFVVGWVGRLIPVKGCDVFLQAMAERRDLPMLASVIGDGPERDRLRALAARHGLAERVHFHGAIEGAAKLFAAFDAWVLSSRSEGTPMVLFEAMAAGVPIVAADVGGVRDVVSEAEACLAPREDPAALAKCLRDIYEGRRRTGDMVRAAAKKLVERWGTDQWIERYVEVYRGLLGNESAALRAVAAAPAA